MITVHFETLGCKLNQIETESICKAFSDYGWNIDVKPITSSSELTEEQKNETKICVVNTCTVTTKAEQKCRHSINLLLKTFPFAFIIVTGCYAQVEKPQIEKISPRIVVIPGMKKSLIAELPLHLNFLFDKNENLEKIVLLVKDLEENCSENIDRFALSTDTFFNHSRSSIKIQDGCGNSCSFCRIHIARGKPVSLEHKIVLERVKKLEEVGQKEVVLTGVNLCQYRSENLDIADLIQYLSENTSNINFRLSSLYPERIDEKFLSALKKSRVRPHFHLSVQSGSDEILKAMNRPYTAKQVLDAVKNLRNIYAIEPFIACDIIVGFPGETEQDFEKTVQLCKECNFTWIHAFPFSARPGTSAAKMKNQIPQETARKRMNILTQIADNQKSAYIKRFEGKNVKAIMEKRQDRLCRCVTENFLHAHVNFPSNLDVSCLFDKEIDVKILSDEVLAKECECECALNFY